MHKLLTLVFITAAFSAQAMDQQKPDTETVDCLTLDFTKAQIYRDHRQFSVFFPTLQQGSSLIINTGAGHYINRNTKKTNFFTQKQACAWQVILERRLAPYCDNLSCWQKKACALHTTK